MVAPLFDRPVMTLPLPVVVTFNVVFIAVEIAAVIPVTAIPLESTVKKDSLPALFFTENSPLEDKLNP